MALLGETSVLKFEKKTPLCRLCKPLLCPRGVGGMDGGNPDRSGPDAPCTAPRPARRERETSPPQRGAAAARGAALSPRCETAQLRLQERIETH